ncbi:MAG: SoxR reducing system RseC family protein [Candidatus Cloacimonetes bacterium]|nr:SoxR reducing system RseC family protein [Candidatus Cloacimonadota bacterium]
MEYKEDIGTVITCGNGEAVVEISPGESCTNCKLVSICGGGTRPSRFRIKTGLALTAGDKVRISVTAGIRIISSLIIFIMPILLMIIFYLFSRFLLMFKENLSILISLVGLAISGLLIYILDKKYAAKIEFTIIGKVEE